jgi:ADP-ribose pyrophosphatase YjhB (NUDIX family)
MPELFDTLKPPLFEKTGEVKDLGHALADQDWLRTFNLWIVQRTPVPSIVYQQRTPNALWAPLKLDVTAGGYFNAGEELKDCMREVKEELGREYPVDQITFVGRKLNVDRDLKKRLRQTVVEIAIVEDNSPIESYELEEAEVYALCACPIEDLIRVHSDSGYSFDVEGVNPKKEKMVIHVTKDSFPPNWDPYHFKIALLAKRFLAGEKSLMY